jgi:3-oxoacyl-[acyl-carrier protein] reductase
MALVKEGANVVITARGAKRWRATAAELRGLGGGEVRTVAGDITTPQAAERRSPPVRRSTS